MDEASPAGANRRRGRPGWRRGLLALGLLPPLAFAASNLCLTSPWARQRIAAKIQHRCGGLQTRIGAASWSPWNGLTLRQIVIAQPTGLSGVIAEPLLQIDSLRLTPRWRSCWHGHFEVLAADLEAPRLVVSLQMLLLLAQQTPQPATPLAAQSAAPAIAAQPPATAAQPATPDLAARPTTQSTPPPTAPGAPGIPPQAQPAPLTPAPAAPQPTAWIRFHDASLRLLGSTSAPPLLELAGVTGGLPISGDAATSSVSVASFKVRGTTLLAGFQAPLAWQSPVLALNPAPANLAGVHLLLAGKLGLLAGLPLLLEAQVPGQSPAPLALAGGGEVKMEHLAGNSRFQGFLLAPGTWQADCLAESSTIAIHAGEHHASFDAGTCCVVLRGGTLSCLDARLVGDEISLLGNATLLADGRAAAVMRLVAAPETTLGILKRFFPITDAAPVLTPLSSPQRVACDLEVSGTLNALQLHLGHLGPLVQP